MNYKKRVLVKLKKLKLQGISFNKYDITNNNNNNI